MANQTIIHPYEVFNIKSLAERLEICENSVRALIKKGLVYSKTGTLTYITGQSVLNYFNKQQSTYQPDQIKKVYEQSGVMLRR